MIMDWRWTQCQLCEQFATPVTPADVCQDIKADHTQKIVNTASAAGEGDGVIAMIPPT